jgi:hypothetical protein
VDTKPTEKTENTTSSSERTLNKGYITHDHSWSLVLCEKLPIVQLLKNFTGFYGTWRFITVFTRPLHWPLS